MEKSWSGPAPRVSLKGLRRKPASLYRHWDHDGVLLYVGITSHGQGRQCRHAATQAWWWRVCFTTHEHYRTRRQAEMAEQAAIRAEAPVYNVIHNANQGKWTTVHPALRALTRDNEIYLRNFDEPVT